MAKNERLLFKIWNKKNEQYVSGNGKTHWRSMKWIASKLKDIKDRGWEMKYFEVQTFELQLIDTQSAEDIYENYESQNRNKKMNKEIAEISKREIQKLVPNISIYQIRSMYKDGLLNTETMILLKPIIEKLVEAERNS